MMTYLIIFLIVSSGSVLGSVFFRKDFECILPFTTCTLALILFLFAVPGLLEQGLYFVLACVVCIYTTCLIYLALTKGFSSFLPRFFSPAFVLFCVSFLLLVYTNYGRHAYLFDEMSHWAVVVKSMFYNDSLATGEFSGITFKSYPPVMALFQYLFVKIPFLLGETEFAEGLMYLAYQVFSLSFIFPFLHVEKWSQFPRAAILAVCLFLAPMLFFSAFYYSLYIDPFLSIVSSCAWAALLLPEHDSKKGHNLIFVMLCASVLILAKDAGAAFAVLLSVAVILAVWSDKLTGQISTVRRKIVFSFLAVAASAVPKLLWSWHLDSMKVVRAFSAPVDIPTFVNVVLGNDNTYRSEVLRLFIDAWTKYSIPFGEFRLTLSYLATTILLLVFLFLVIFFLNRKSAEKAAVRRCLYFLIVVQNLIYIAGLCLMYMFKFSEREALELASFGRYTNIVLLMDYLVVLLLVSRLAIRVSVKACLPIFAACMLLSPLGTVSQLITRWNTFLSHEADLFYGPHWEKVLSHTDESDSIYFISQDDPAYEYFYFRYKLFPQMSKQNDAWSIGPSDDHVSVPLSPELWRETLLRDFDYVFVLRTNDYFSENFASLFSDAADISDSMLYRIDKSSEKLVPVLD